MSRIEEALRRARSTALEDRPPPAAPPREPALPPDLILRPAATDAVPDAVDLPDVFQDLRLAEPVNEPAAPEPPPQAPLPPPVEAPVYAQTPAHVEAPAPVQVQPQPAPARNPPAELGETRADAIREAREQPRRSGALANDKLVLCRDMPPAVVEQYRKVAATLHQLQLDRGTKIVMIASAMAEDGKTITASNIALTLSESFRRRVLLIDADLRRPSIHAMFGTPNATGLNDALTAEQEQKLTIFEVTPHLSVLPSGRPNPDPMSCLSSDRMRKIITEAGSKFDWVIIDTPPVGVLADAKLLAEMVHAVVLVIGAGRTAFRAVERAIEALDRKRIAGVVLNRVTEQPASYQYYNYSASSPRG